MSYGTRKAIAGTTRACERAAANVNEAIRRAEIVQTADDARLLLAWVKEQPDWFFRTGEDDRRMQAAIRTMCDRVNCKTTAGTGTGADE